jgi:heat shock protein HtpX
MVYAHLRNNRIATGFIVIAFVSFIVGLSIIFSEIQSGEPFLFALPTLFFALFYVLVSLAFSKNAVLAMSHAKKMEEKDSPELYHTLENLAISRGVPMPALYLIQDSAPNAFATGTFKKHSAVAVTTGLLDKLEKAEIEGVLAHELAHIQHEDTRLMTIVVLLVGVVTLLADFFLRSMYWSGRGQRDSKGKGNAILLFVGILLALLSPLIAQLLKLAVSRKREFYADAEAALTTRYPDGLASALEKITADQEPLEVANRATAHLYICDPMRNVTTKWLAPRSSAGRSGGGWHTMFSTHPDAEERIERLRKMMT